MQKRLIRVAHSPDSDDAFMFYALAKDKIDTGEFRFDHVLSDIQTLNQEALKGTYEVSAISFHAFPQVADRYALLPSGSSMGDRYGPMVIAREPHAPSVLREKKVAVPGLMTTAFLALRLYEPNIDYVVMPFNEILPAVAEGKVDLGLIIHEGQLTYVQSGLHKIVDLGEWWYEKTGGLPLPLGGNVVRKDLGPENCLKVSDILRKAIQYSLDHRPEALDYALSFARGMDPKTADRFVGMYVNELTVDYGERGRAALRRLFEEATAKKLIPEMPSLQFVGD
ncbi:ABC transporter substrate-binding protein [Deltaproteobacteria bacterium PRO3]|nr:ABC transporter substrate-binding protein [Deltaproteobacteria bacterium PRO3]